MKHSTLGYLISEGFKSFGKQKKMTSASIIIMFATMLMFGVFFVISQNINYVMKQIENQQAIKVNIEEDLTDDEITALKNQIRAIDGVNNVEYSSKEDALSTVKKWLGDNQYLIQGWEGENNPFPASFVVTLTDLSMNKTVQEQITALDGVSEINSKNDTMESLQNVARIVQAVTMILLAILIAISVFIIAYTVKLTVHARRREISIMKYVGATNNFIRGPFIVEGVLIGIISALLVLATVGISYNVLIEKASETSIIKNMSISLLQFNDIFLVLLGTYLLLGIGIGVIGSIISMRKYLDV